LAHLHWLRHATRSPYVEYGSLEFAWLQPAQLHPKSSVFKNTLQSVFCLKEVFSWLRPLLIRATIYGQMTFLVTTAIISLFVIVLVVVFAYVRSKDQQDAHAQVPFGVSDAAILTYRETLARIELGWHAFLPFVHHMTAATLSRYLAFRDRTYMRIFGQAAVPRGGATSYFLKRIIAHKEEFAKMKAERSALHSEIKNSERGDMLSQLLGNKSEG
jgi:hypothetical protein